MYSIQQIKEILKASGELQQANLVVKHLLTDSRKLHSAENTMFFAISGERLNGHHYIKDLYDRGVRNFVVEQEEINFRLKGANILLVDNSIRAMQTLATYHRNHFKIPVVGITGSNGKTIIKEWCYQLLQDDFTICRSPKSYNSQIGVPLSVWNLQESHSLGVFEAGISEPGEMEYLEKIIQPTIGIFSNIGAAHGANFIREEHKVREKLKLFIKSKVLIFCGDQSVVNQTITALWGMAKMEGTQAPELFAWGKSTQAKVQILEQKTTPSSCEVAVQYQEQQYFFSIPFVDISSIENSMHLVALLLYLEYDQESINERLALLHRIAMRLEQKSGVNNCLIINDSYNSDIDSLKIALDFLSQQQKQPKRTLILSDILQSGIPSIDLYQSVAQLVESAEAHRFIGIGAALCQHKYLFTDANDALQTEFYTTTQEFLEQVNDYNFQDEAILLKGARKFSFEKISLVLEEKAHATVLEINLSAVLQNFQFFNSLVKENTKVMVMVKAFSYGAGSYEIAKLLEFHRIDYLGVAYADEGVSLRKAGIATPILVLNPEQRSFEAMIRYKLEPEIYSMSLLKQLISVLNETKHNEAFPIHLNIDTGMKRLGFDAEELGELTTYLHASSAVEVKGIFSHLAASDDQKWDEFTQEQIDSFESNSSEIMTGLNIKPIRHLCNSNGITRFPNAHYDMVRLGLGLYGLNEMYANKLTPVGVLKSTISQIKKVKKGETIGYGRIGKAKENITIATIAIGYADGMSRLLSNGVGSVFLHGKRAPVIGTICMDMTMINVSAIPNAAEGDVVEIFGENISVNEIAKQTNTISYEVLTSISERVKRVYFVD